MGEQRVRVMFKGAGTSSAVGLQLGGEGGGEERGVRGGEGRGREGRGGEGRGREERERGGEGRRGEGRGGERGEERGGEKRRERTVPCGACSLEWHLLIACVPAARGFGDQFPWTTPPGPSPRQSQPVSSSVMWWWLRCLC